VTFEVRRRRRRLNLRHGSPLGGRSPNGRKIGAEAAGIAVDARGFIRSTSDAHQRCAHLRHRRHRPQPMLAHKAVHEGHVAAEAARAEGAF